MKTVKKTALILVVVILLAFIVLISSLNLEAVHLNGYVFDINASLGFIVLTCLLVGVLVGIITSYLLWIWSARREMRYWQRQYYQLKQNPKQTQNISKTMVSHDVKTV